MAFKMKAGLEGPFKKNYPSVFKKEPKRYYNKKTYVDPDDTRNSFIKQTFGSGGREGDNPNKHKQVILHKFTKGNEDTFYKKKAKHNVNIPTKSKKISKARHDIESGVRKLFTIKKNK